MATKKTETKATKKTATKKAETKKTDTKKVEKQEVKKDTRVWKSGHPIASGTYLVKLDGKEVKLQWLQGIKLGKWITLDGKLATGKVEGWTTID